MEYGRGGPQPCLACLSSACPSGCRRVAREAFWEVSVWSVCVLVGGPGDRVLAPGGTWVGSCEEVWVPLTPHLKYLHHTLHTQVSSSPVTAACS